MKAFDVHRVDNLLKNNMSRHDILDLVLMMVSQVDDEDPRRGFEYLGFGSMKSYVRDFDKGLGMQPESFVKIALAFHHSPDKPVELFDYLIKTEGWRELEQYLPPILIAKLGLKVAENGRPKSGENFDNIKPTKGGTSASYTIKRLAKDADADERIAKLYDKVRQGVMSANAAAIEAGYKKPNLQMTKDPAKVVEKLKREFTDEEIRYIKQHL